MDIFWRQSQQILLKDPMWGWEREEPQKRHKGFLTWVARSVACSMREFVGETDLGGKPRSFLLHMLHIWDVPPKWLYIKSRVQRKGWDYRWTLGILSIWETSKGMEIDELTLRKSINWKEKRIKHQTLGKDYANYLDCGNHFTICMYIKSLCCTP